MSKRKPPTPPADEKVINLNDLRKRIEAETKKTDGTVGDIFKELFGSAFGFPSSDPYDQALRKQQQQQQEKAYAEHIAATVKREITDPAMEVINNWKDAFQKLKEGHDKFEAAYDKAFAGYKSWKAEAERLQGMFDDLRKEGVNVDLGYVIDGVIDTLRNDPRMPKLSLFEWEQLLGDHYGIETIDIAEEVGDLDEDDGEEAA
jgi:signal recognition particle GTPase